MQAAAHGRSTLGIPTKVGREFVEATPKGARLPERRRRKESPSQAMMRGMRRAK